jgi:uncharacterized membrane protein
MVIAPMLGPNIALSLSAALGDLQLAIKAMRSIAIGIGVALLISVIVGYFVPFDPSINEIATRTDVGYGYIILGLADVITFSAQGVRPDNWSEIDGAKKAIYYALSIWIILLLIMALLIYISQEQM